MPEYLGEPDYAHDSQERLGILLANLGTPDSPAPSDVRRFLAEFLWDPRVIEAPRWLWWLALHGVILRTRPAKSSHAYRQIWTTAGSPLLIHSRAIAAALQNHASQRDAVVALGMTYGRPSLSNALRELKQQGVRRLLVLPLYPQYSATTTASVFDRVTQELQQWRWVPETRFVTSYADEPVYIEAIANQIREHWRIHERAHLLFSFHGIPRRYLLGGDPYHCQCQKSARLIAQALQLEPSEWSVSFQSQVGRERWLEPYTDELLARYANEGPKRVTVVCPGFATDCLETLEEIAIRNRAAFLEQGGEYFDYVPALNASDVHIELLAQVIERHTQGWHSTNEASDLAARRARALALGATR
jgi:protoporphyrin/coproporphyrin ferrochelatase